jgi:hypothetical protein
MGWFDELKQLFIGGKDKMSGSKGKSAESPDLKTLKEPLGVTVERQGQSKVMQFQLTEMALNAFVFETKSPVVEREMLTLEILLPELGKQKLTGSVSWVLPAASNYTGQLNIWTTPEQRRALFTLIKQKQRY